MKTISIFLLTFASLNLAGQYTLKDAWAATKGSVASATLSGISGLSNGLNQTLDHHYDRFKYKFPGANDRYWNPDISWQNKYENGLPSDGPAYWGSTTFLAWTTDAYHLTNTISRTSLFAAGCTFTIGQKKHKKKLGHRLIDIGIGLTVNYLAYSAGFHLVYDVIFPKYN